MKNRSFIATLTAVAWAFLGLRRKKDFDVDAEGTIKPLYLVVAGAIGLAAFIALLVFAVKMAVPVK
jgi:hypothetical protein